MNLPKKIYYKTKNTLWRPVERRWEGLRIEANILADARLRRFDPSQSLLMNGFWRSGTTISQDLFAAALGAKRYFEPLEPGWPSRRRFIVDYAEATGIDIRNWPLVAVLMPGAPAAGEDPYGLWTYLDTVVRGRHGELGMVRTRTSLREGWRSGRCIKFVRAHFILEELVRRYDLPLIHLRRNPLAVIASLMKVPHWNQDGFNHLDLACLLAGPDKTGAEIHGWYRPLLRALSGDLSKVEQIAAYWCVAELSAEAQLQRLGARAVVVQFEGLMRHRETAVREALGAIGRSPRKSLGSRPFERMSKTTHVAVSAQKDYNPEKAYRKTLDAAQIARIGAVMDHFGLSLDALAGDAAESWRAPPLRPRESSRPAPSPD